MLMLPRLGVVFLLLALQSLVLVGCSDGEAKIVDTGTYTDTGDNPDNVAPLIVSTAPLSATEDTLYTYQLAVTDPDDANNGVDLRYALTQAPAGMTINATGLISWMPTEGVSSATVQVGVIDGGENGAGPAVQSFNISVTAVNDAPLISSAASTSAVVGSEYQYQIIVTDTDDSNNGTDISFTLTQAPAGMTVSATGLVRWMPALGGSSEGVTVVVSDGGEDGALPATQTYSIAVAATNVAPVITSAAVTSATEGAAYNYAVTVDDIDDANNGTDLTFTLTQAPGGMVVSSTGVISWTPGEGGALPWSSAVTVQVADGGESGSVAATQTFNVNVTPVNNAPVIMSTALTSATEDSPYSYQLVAVDSDDAAAELSFSLTASPVGMTISPAGLIEWVPTDGVTSADVTAQVADGGEDGAVAATQSWTVAIDGINDAPVISSSALTGATEGVEYQYALSVTDPDDDNNGSDLTFQLVTAPAGMLISNLGVITWTPEEGGATLWTESVTVEVADGGEDGASAVQQSWVVSVTPVNNAPTITQSSPISVSMSEDSAPIAFSLTLDATDTDSALLTWSIIGAAANGGASVVGAAETASGEGQAIDYTPNAGFVGDDSFVVRVSDGELFSDISVNVSIGAINNAPTITSVAPLIATEDTPYQYQLAVNDPDDDNDGSALTFSLIQSPAGMTVSSTGLIEWLPLEGDSSATVSVEVADGGEDGAVAATQNWVINVTAVNDAPVITSVAPTSAVEALLYQYQVTVTDPDDLNNGVDLSFSLGGGAPAGMTISATGLISWMPTPGAGVVAVDLFVADGGEDGTAAATQSWTISVGDVNNAPAITSVAPTSATEGNVYSYQLVVNDPDDANNGTDLTFSLGAGAPIGMTISSTGLIAWTPPNGVTSANVSVQVADGGENGAAAATQTWVITVGGVNDAPTITSSAPLSATEDQLYQYQLSVNDPDDANDGASLTYSLLASPAGMTVSTTGLIQWTPQEGDGVIAVSIQVADGGENGATPAQQDWNIDVTAVNDAPMIASAAPTGATEGGAYQYQVAVNDPDDLNDGSALAFTLTAAPAGMTVSATGLISWTPPNGVASADVSIQVADGGEDGAAAATQSWTITVGGVNDAPTITSAAPTTATEGAVYSYQIVVNDPDDVNNGTDIAFTLGAGAPENMTISSTGLISWTPPNGVTSANVSVQAADGGENGAAAATQSWVITVTSVNDAPTITSVAPTAATEGNLYQYQLEVNDVDDANNGVDLAFSLGAGAPVGMTVSSTGLIAWTPPNGATDANVSVQVADGGEDGTSAATQSWIITVGGVNDAPTITSTAPTIATEGNAYSYQIVVNDPDDVNNGTDITFTLGAAAPENMTISSTGLIAWTPPNGVTSANVSVQVADGGENGAAAATQSWTITVTSVNDAPTITSVAPTAATEGNLYQYQLEVNDVDDANNGVDLAFSLGAGAPSGMTISSTGLIAWTPANGVTSANVSVQVADGGEDGTSAATQSWTITVGGVNDAPTITSVAPTTAVEGNVYSYQLVVNDPDDDNNGTDITFTLGAGAPETMTISSTGLIAWTPPNGVTSANVSVQVADGGENGAAAATQSWTITVAAVNQAPTITSAASTTATEGSPYQYQVAVNDPDDLNDGTALTFTLTAAPAGMTVSATGLISWTPPNGVASADVSIQVADGGEDGAAAATQSWTIIVGDVNDAPTITSVAPTTATEGDAYSYQVVVNDPDDSNNGTDISFTLGAGSPAGMTISSTGLIAWTPPNGVTSANVSVQAADGGENGAAAATQSWTITVAAVNQAPTITSVAPTSATEGSVYSYQLVINDPDDENNGTDLTFSLGAGAPTGMTISATGLIAWTPANGVASADVSVQVADGGENGAAAATQAWTITVDGVNDAPTITSSAPLSATEDQLYQYQLSVNDPDDANDGASLTYSLLASPAGMTVSTTGLIQWTPQEGDGVIAVSIQVADGGENGATPAQQDWSINVTAVNDAPMITSTASTSATEASLYQYQVLVSDPDDANNGIDLIFTLGAGAPSGMTISSTGMIAWTPANGVISANVSVQVADGGEDGTSAATQSWTITVGGVNDAPTITSVAPTTAVEGNVYSYQLVVNDPDDDNNGTDITFTLGAGAPETMTISSTGLIAWTPPNGVTSANVSVQAADGGENGAAAATQSWTITVAAVNQAPTITSAASTTATEGSPYQYQVAVNDPDDLNDGTALTFTLTAAPAGMTVSATGLISWTPPNGVASADVSIQVADGGEDGAAAATQSWTIIVGDVNDAPTITSVAPTTATEGDAYSYQVVVNDPDDSNNGTDISFTLGAGSPAGMTISSTGLIAWTPPNGVTSANVSVQAADGGENGAAAAAQSWTITVTPVNDAPDITQASPVAVSMSEDGTPNAFALTLNAIDVDSATLTWSISAAASNGVASATGTGGSKVIGYTPSENFSGTDQFDVRVSDGELQDTVTVVVTVDAENDAPTITSAALTTATEDVLYQYSATVTDIDGPAATWSLTNSPTGMTISAAGLVQWTPSENGVAPWSTDVVMEVTDGMASDTQSFTISVTPVNDAPSISSLAPTAATEGVAYSYQLVVSDDDDANNGSDLTFTLNQSPASMSISATGLITWTPENGDADADISVSVADGGEDGAAAATQSWTITTSAVNDAPQITSSAPTTATEGSTYSYQLAVNDPDDANDGTQLTFALNAGAPASMTISSTGLITWTPQNGDSSASVTVTVADGGENGVSPATQSWVIAVTAVNDAPVITQGDSASVTMSENGSPTPFALTLNATDVDSASLTWSIQSAATNGIATASGAGNSKAISYTPDAGYNGGDSFVVRVSDGDKFDDITVSVTVSAVNDAPQITSSAGLSASEGSLYQYNAVASDTDSPTLTWSLVTGPAGMAIDANSGVLTWTPSEGGSVAWDAGVGIQVSDGDLSATQNFVISVAPVNNTPEISEGNSVAVTMSEDGTPIAFALTLNATDSENDPLNWSIQTVASNGAATVTAGAANSNVIGYTPTDDYAGVDSFVVRVSDGAATDDITVNVTVTAVNDAPSITSSAVTSADEGVAYQYDVEAEDVDTASLTYSLTESPAGMTIDSSTGVIQWMPADQSEDVTVQVSDGSESVTQSFTITVTAEQAVVGRVMKGILSGAAVEASVYSAGSWVTLGTTTTNADGRYGFDLPTQSAPVRIRVTTTVSSTMLCDAPLGCGAAAFGEDAVPAVDLTLDTIVRGSQFAGPIAVTPLTNMAAQWISDMPRGVNDDVIVLANRRVADLFGLDENFAHTRAIDITDAGEVSVAVASDMPLVRHALFAAALQQLSASEVMELETVTRGVAQMFSVLGGQMLLQTGAIDLTELGLELDTDTVNYVGFDTIVSSATAVANAVNVGGALDALIASLPTLQTRWGERLLTAMGEGTGYNAADFARALAPLDEFDYYYGLSEAGAAGLDPVNRSVGWLYTDETARNNTEGMVNALMDVIGGGFKASVCVPSLRNSTSCTVESDFNTSISSCSSFSSTCKFTVSGTFAGQTVSVEIPSTPDIRYLLGGTKPFGSYDNSDGISLHFVGTITNATATTTMDIYVDINLSNNDLSTFEGFSALNYANETQLNAALDELVADIFIDARLSGSMSIASSNAAIGTYSISNLDSGFIFNRRTITQGETTPIMILDVETMSRTNPAGETLSSLSGTDMFLLELDDVSTLHTASRAVNLGLPEIRTIMDGQVSGLQPLIDVLSDYIVSAIDTTTPTPEVDWDAVTADIADAVISGSGTMDIRDAPQKLYTFGLNADGTIDVSQVNSTSNAMTIDLKGVAGYVYANNTLVSTAHLGNADDGLMLSLVNDTQRSYPNANPSATAQLDGLLALIQQLFPPAPEPAP